MALLVRTKCLELIDHVWRSQPRHEYLARIDVDCPMLPGVINLDDAITKVMHGNQPPRPPRINCMNSARVRASSRKSPSI